MNLLKRIAQAVGMDRDFPTRKQSNPQDLNNPCPYVTVLKSNNYQPGDVIGDECGQWGNIPKKFYTDRAWQKSYQVFEHLGNGKLGYRIAQAVNSDADFPNNYDYWIELTQSEKRYLPWSLGPDTSIRIWKYRDMRPFYLVDDTVVDLYLTTNGSYPDRWDLFNTTDIGQAKARAEKIIKQLKKQAPEHYGR